MLKSKSPRQVVEDLREWFRTEAGELPDAAKRDVMAALANPNPEFACIELFRLQDAGEVPASWGDRLRALWDCAR
jgi:hypothetical protein